MKRLLFTAILATFCHLSYAQDKVTYSVDERKALSDNYFNAGFKKPATKKLSTLKLKDGTEIIGYCTGIDNKQGQIYALDFKDSISGDKKTYQADQIASAILYESAFDKLKAFNKSSTTSALFNNALHKKKVVNNDQALFVQQNIALKNKKTEKAFIMQVINPNFMDYIKVFHDPNADETSGISLGGFSKLGGGVIKSYYVAKGDKTIWLRDKDLKENYEFLFGDSPEFMKKYPYNSVKWEWLGGLIMEYSKIKSGVTE